MTHTHTHGFAAKASLVYLLQFGHGTWTDVLGLRIASRQQDVVAVSL
jgi:hypothetical protein